MVTSTHVTSALPSGSIPSARGGWSGLRVEEQWRGPRRKKREGSRGASAFREGPTQAGWGSGPGPLPFCPPWLHHTRPIRDATRHLSPAVCRRHMAKRHKKRYSGGNRKENNNMAGGGLNRHSASTVNHAPFHSLPFGKSQCILQPITCVVLIPLLFIVTEGEGMACLRLEKKWWT